MNASIKPMANVTRFDADLDEIKHELGALLPSRRRQTCAKLRELYPAIDSALKRGITQKDALGILKAHGISLSVATFRRMLVAERVRREQCDGRPGKSNMLDQSSTCQEPRAQKLTAVADEQVAISSETNTGRSSHAL